MKRLALAVLLLASPAAAQQQTEQEFFQHVVAALQRQRNIALDEQARLLGQAALQATEIAKLKARIEELEKAAPK